MISFADAVCTGNAGYTEVLASNYHFASFTDVNSVTTYTPCDFLIFTGVDTTNDGSTGASGPVYTAPPISSNILAQFDNGRTIAGSILFKRDASYDSAGYDFPTSTDLRSAILQHTFRILAFDTRV